MPSEAEALYPHPSLVAAYLDRPSFHIGWEMRKRDITVIGFTCKRNTLSSPTQLIFKTGWAARGALKNLKKCRTWSRWYSAIEIRHNAGLEIGGRPPKSVDSGFSLAIGISSCIYP